MNPHSLLTPCFVQDRKLCAHPYLEIYKGDLIYYMSPLARQSDFYVPEVQAAERKPEDAEESEDDRGTDITGMTPAAHTAASRCLFLNTCFCFTCLPAHKYYYQ